MTKITKDNIVEVLKFNGFSFIRANRFIKNDNHIVIDNRCDYEFFADMDYTGQIATNDFDEFLAFVQKRIELKSLPELLENKDE